MRGAFSMLRKRIIFNVVLMAALLAGGMCRAQQPAPSQSTPVPEASSATPAPQAPVIQVEAIDALKQMGASLRTLRTFSVTADITVDEVLLSRRSRSAARTR